MFYITYTMLMLNIKSLVVRNQYSMFDVNCLTFNVHCNFLCIMINGQYQQANV